MYFDERCALGLAPAFYLPLHSAECSTNEDIAAKQNLYERSTSDRIIVTGEASTLQ